MDLEVLADFGLVAAHGSVSAAARLSGRPKSTLSRHVIALERHLSVVLFDRTDRSFDLTPKGAELFTRTRALVEQLRHVEDEIRRVEPRRSKSPDVADPQDAPGQAVAVGAVQGQLVSTDPCSRDASI